jgi:hypothetical protein
MKIISMRFFKVVICATLMLVSSIISAAEWSLDTGVKARTSYNDNVNLSSDVSSEKTSTSGSVNPDLEFKINDQSQDFKALLDVDLTRYKNEPELSRDEGALDLSWTTRSERGEFSLSSGYSQETSLDQAQDFSGIIDEKATRNNVYISPFWMYVLSKKDKIQLQYSFTDSKYDEPGASGFDIIKLANFKNYQQHNYSVFFAHDFTERNNLAFSVSFTDYKAEGNGLLFRTFIGSTLFADEELIEYQALSYQLELVHNISELHLLSFSFGVNEIDTENSINQHQLVATLSGVTDTPGVWLTAESERQGSQYEFAYKFTSENESVSIVAGQDLVSESTGALVDKQQLALAYAFNNSERLTTGLSLEASKNEVVVGLAGGSFSNRERASLRAYFSWKLEKDWWLSVHYLYSYLEQDISTETADSNEISLSINWRWPRTMSTY